MNESSQFEIASYPPCECEKCGDTGSIIERLMTGGRVARLCLGCFNAWTEWILAQSALATYRRFDAILDAWVHRGAGEYGDTIASMLIESQQKLFALSGEWLAEKATVEEPSP